MNYLFVLSLILSLNISVMQATCSKTFVLPEIRHSEDHNNPPPLSASPVLNNNNSDTNYSLHQKGTMVRHENQEEQIDLNSLRLEYNKYKILSHLGMTANPDELATRLSDHDEDVRSQLASGFKYNDIRNQDGTNNMANNVS